MVKLAQYDALAQELLSGKVPDANGYITIDAAGHSTEYRLFPEEIFKNGVIRRRQPGRRRSPAPSWTSPRAAR